MRHQSPKRQRGGTCRTPLPARRDPDSEWVPSLALRALIGPRTRSTHTPTGGDATSRCGEEPPGVNDAGYRK